MKAEYPFIPKCIWSIFFYLRNNITDANNINAKKNFQLKVTILRKLYYLTLKCSDSFDNIIY